MAQAGFTPISLYFSTTASAVPSSGNLANGELGLNIADMKLYAKNSAGTVTLLASSSGAAGTVSSVAMSVPSFLTVTGSPITTSGTLAVTYSGTALPIANGGTGQTTATAAFDALAPSQGGNSGKYLTTNGTTTSWGTVDALPSQTGNAGKYLSTNGTVASWENTGASAGGVIWENSLVVSSNYTLTTNKNGFSVGPITINSGVTVTVPSGQRWVIL
jgi:hypothetical protein